MTLIVKETHLSSRTVSFSTYCPTVDLDSTLAARYSRHAAALEIASSPPSETAAAAIGPDPTSSTASKDRPAHQREQSSSS